MECSILSLPEGYRKSAPPPGEMGRLPILLEVKIISFPEINVTKMKLVADFILTLTWFDQRLSFFNLKPSVALNAMTLQDLELIWVPEILFANTEGNQLTLVDGRTEAYVRRNGTYTLNSLSENRYAK